MQRKVLVVSIEALLTKSQNGMYAVHVMHSYIKPVNIYATTPTLGHQAGHRLLCSLIINQQSMLSPQHQPVKFLGLLTVILDGRLDLCIVAMVEMWVLPPRR